MIKKIYLLYAVCFRGVSVIRLWTDFLCSKSYWVAHDRPQDGYGGHDGLWVEATTPWDAVWKLRMELNKKIAIREVERGSIAPAD